MPYQVGQLVQCKRALHPGHIKLVGCIGEIKQTLNLLEALIYGAEYVVFFPNYPVGQCPYCDRDHDPLHFLMFGIELKPEYAAQASKFLAEAEASQETLFDAVAAE